jgi:hypothetical protein
MMEGEQGKESEGQKSNERKGPSGESVVAVGRGGELILTNHMFSCIILNRELSMWVI